MCMNGDAAQKLPEDMPTCLCNVAFNLQPEVKWLPEWRYNRETKELMLMCPNCKFHTPAFDNKPAVIANWALTNRAGDAFILQLWNRDYKNQSQNAA